MTLPQLAWGGYTTNPTCQQDYMDMNVNCYGPNLTSCTASMNGHIVCSGPKLQTCGFSGYMNGQAICIGGTTAPQCTGGMNTKCLTLPYQEAVLQCAVYNKIQRACTLEQLHNYAQAIVNKTNLPQILQPQAQALAQALAQAQINSAVQVQQNALTKVDRLNTLSACLQSALQAIKGYSDLTAVVTAAHALGGAIEQVSTVAHGQLTAANLALQAITSKDSI